MTLDRETERSALSTWVGRPTKSSTITGAGEPRHPSDNKAYTTPLDLAIAPQADRAPRGSPMRVEGPLTAYCLMTHDVMVRRPLARRLFARPKSRLL
jgi:hypothetical protein